MQAILKNSGQRHLPKWFPLVFLVLVSFAHQSVAAERSAAAKKQTVLKSGSPLHIASDRMEVNQKDRTITFEGHVMVQQDDLTISGKQLRVYAAKSDAGSGKGSQAAMMDRIDRIEIEGDVKISQKDKIATADKAVYYHEKQKIVLMGRPRVSQGQDTIQGRLITLYLREERSVVEGGEETPVQAVLHPEGGT